MIDHLTKEELSYQLVLKIREQNSLQNRFQELTKEIAELNLNIITLEKNEIPRP